MGRVCSVGEDLDILYFWEDSAPIPHFHLVDKATFGRLHNGTEGKLSDEQCQLLVAALNSTEHFDKWTNWQYLLHTWNINNPEHEVDIDIPMPDYMNLNNL